MAGYFFSMGIGVIEFKLYSFEVILKNSSLKTFFDFSHLLISLEGIKYFV